MAKKKIDNEIFKTLIEDYNIKDTNDIKDMLKDLLSGTIQTMLEAEIEHWGMLNILWKIRLHLTARNGHSKKTVRSEYGNIDLDIPRDRNAEFEPQIIPKYQKEKLLALKGRFFLFMLKEWATEISRTILIIFMELMFRHLWSVKLQIKLYLKLGNGSLDSLRMNWKTEGFRIY